MSVVDSIKIAFYSLVSHKMRSILTMIGIVIGVGSIITIVAIGQGGTESLKSQFTNAGENTLDIQFHQDKHSTINNKDVVPAFSQEDIFLIRKVPEILHVLTTNTAADMIVVGDRRVDTSILGVNYDYQVVKKIKTKQGVSLNEVDFKHSNNVTMINQKAANMFFKNQNPIGKLIELKGQILKVIGVYETKNTAYALGQPEILVPISIWPALYGNDTIQSVTIQTDNFESLESSGNKVIKLLNSQKSLDLQGKYEILNIAEIQEGISSITNIMTAIIAGIASISLVVGGIGVMNIMLVSVTERTREIGIRKALGASKRKILLQFLIESVMLTFVGGIIGIVLGVAGSFIVSSIAKWPPLISPAVVMGAVLFSMSLGIIFGLVPANKAAKLEPMEALRYE